MRRLSARSSGRGRLLDRAGGGDPLEAATRRRGGLRERIRRSPGLALAYRIGVGVLGGTVLAAGIVMIPYPGPGWLVVFAGLAILATEFAWAGRVLRYAKSRYDMWEAWLCRQRPAVRVAIWLATAVVVVLTLWLLDVYELVGGWFGLEWTWLSSPLL